LSNLTSNSNNGSESNNFQPVPVRAPGSVWERDEWFEIEDFLKSAEPPKNKLGFQRRQARIVTLLSLFESDSVNHDPLMVTNRYIETFDLSADVARFTRNLVMGVIGSRDKLDALISGAASSWPVDQMAKVDKNILRLAIFEILFNNDVPTKAAINEAIELAKSFGSDSSSRFVNGVLGAIVAQQAKEREAETQAAPDQAD
jgi:transcription antitermination protein NusB